MMHISGMAERNLCRNKKYCEKLISGELINGQGLGIVSRMRYGLCSMSYNGCGVIAVYNALAYTGKNQPLCEIAHYMERYKLLFGIFGCNPYRLGDVLSHYGAAFERFGDTDASKAFIVSYRTKRTFISPVHTVFCVRTNDGITIYNRYNSCPVTQQCGSLSELTRGRKPIAVYNMI